MTTHWAETRLHILNHCMSVKNRTQKQTTPHTTGTTVYLEIIVCVLSYTTEPISFSMTGKYALVYTLESSWPQLFNQHATCSEAQIRYIYPSPY